jgi:MOSC domain-containing protein YiiM
MVRSLNLDGDGQADLTVHGGSDKAVYVYPFEHYDYWRGKLPQTELPLAACRSETPEALSSKQLPYNI